MDPYSLLDPKIAAIVHKYADPVKGAADVAGALGQGLVTQIGSGLAGIKSGIQGSSMDAAARGVDDYQRENGVNSLSPEGIKTVQGIAPAYRAVANSRLGQAVGDAGAGANELLDKYADTAGQYSPMLGAATFAAGKALPQAIFPEGAEGEAALSGLGGDALESAARAPVPHTISMEAAGDDFQPSARAIVARHPETGAELGRMTLQPRGGVMTGIRSDVVPEAQGQGIGTKLLQSGIDHAYANGMDFASDTSITPPQMSTYLKLRAKGYPVDVNPNAEEWDSPDGPALRSSDGAPVVSVKRPTAATDADSSDLPPAMVVPHRYGYGAMMNGQVMSTHGDQAGAQSAVDFLNADHKYGALAQSMADNGGTTYHPGTGTNPSEGYSVSLHKGREQVQATQPTPQDIHDYITKNQDAFQSDPQAHFGEWHNKDNGQHYLDVSHVDPDLDSAMQKAKDNNQEAIFDLGSFNTIPNPDFAPAAAPAGPEGVGAPVVGVPHMAEGGEAGAVFGGLSDLIRKYADNPKAVENFKAWHDGSQVPQVVYHQTNAVGFPAFNTNPRYDLGSHFGTANQANDRLSVRPNEVTKSLVDDMMSGQEMHPTNTIPAYLSMKNPLRTQDLGSWDAMRVKRWLLDNPDQHSIPADALMNNATNKPDFLKQVIKNHGYDGFVYRNTVEDPESQADSYLAFDPTQIKSSVGNSGDFDPSNPDFTKASGGSVRSFADGGEAGAVLGGLGDLIDQFAPEAKTIADHVGEKGGITYNPSTGDVHGSGYVLPSSSKVTALDAAPTPEDVHNFMMDNQGEFDDPSSVLHVHSDDDGNHFMHVAKYSPDFGHAADQAGQSGLPGFADVATGETHPASPGATDLPNQTSSPDPSDLSEYLQSSRTSTPWTPGQQTVANPKRNAFPGIYNDPRQVIADSAAKVGPEDPLLQQLFGVSRSDLSDLALSRQGNELGVLPGTKANPRGAASAQDVMTPKNEQRLIDVLGEAKNSPDLYKGMTGWYSMDPLYQRFVQIFGEDEAPAKYKQFNTLSGMASPGSDVGTEIARGTSANWLQNEGRFGDFVRHGGGVDAGPSGDRPADMAELPGHVYHRTAQAIPMQQYLDTGQLQMKSPKVPMYIQASGVPETGFQTDMPVGDAHWARGVGLADTRGTRTSKGQEIVPGSSVSTPEMDTLGPWWKNRVASQVGLESVPAQALAWGAFSPYTGVKSAIGAPKLEILSTQIGKLAQRLGVSPETARDLVISGKAGAFAEGGSVTGPVLSGLADLVAKYAPDMKPITNTLYRGTEGGTPGAALRKSSDGEIGPGIYYTPHKWLASSYGGGPKASVKDGTRVVHEATVDQLAPEHVAYAWQPKADAGTGAPTYITSHTGDLLHTYDPLGNTPEAVQSRMAIPGVMQQNGVKMIVGHDDSIAGNQVSVIDPSVLKLKDPASTAGILPPSSQSTP